MSEHMHAPDKTDQNEAPLEEIVDEAIDQSDGEKISMAALLDAWGDRSYGPLFIVLGFMGGTPLAAIPGAAAVVGVVIAALALQMALGKTHPWLPGFILKRSIREKDLRKIRKKTEPALRFLDRLITERLTWATGKAMRRAAAIFITALGILMVPFDAIPFAVAAPAWAVVLFGLAITARDGLVMLLALAACLAIAWLAVYAM